LRAADVARILVDTAAGAFTETAGRALERDRLPPDDHRPWPVPREPWVMAQTWEHLLFAHWPVPVRTMAARVPKGLSIDVFDGSAWLAVTPFRVRRLRLRGTPAVPGLSDFHEVNVRTYVIVEDKPGVFFFSLDADTLLGVYTARLWYRLPYFFATALLDPTDRPVAFSSARTHSGAPDAKLGVRYRPVEPVRPAPRGSLEWWLTERYCLYTVDDDGTVHRAEIHHTPWPLQRAEAEIETNTMAVPIDLDLRARPALLHYAERLDVRVWRPARAAVRT
jgi:uncharacterized protein YqjF (DUF2071 family)